MEATVLRQCALKSLVIKVGTPKRNRGTYPISVAVHSQNSIPSDDNGRSTLRCVAVAFRFFLVIAFAAPSDAKAEGEAAWGHFSATIGLTSDYRYLGQSQTSRGTAVQGSIDYNNNSGLFASIWISTIKLDKLLRTAPETDFSGGYAYAFSDATKGSIAISEYWYAASRYNRYNYVEVSGDLSHNFGKFALEGELAFSPDFSETSGNGVRIRGGVDIPVTVAAMHWLSASGHVGYQSVKNNLAYGTPDWLFYDAGLTATWRKFALDLRYDGTDTTKAACFGGTNRCGGGIVLSLTVSLPGE